MRISRRAEQGSEFVSDPANRAAARQARLLGFKRHDWVVVAKTPLAGLEVVLDHLSRYTQRVAVSNERIVGIDAKRVRLRVRADDRGGKRSIVIDSATFIGRFLQHVLPTGFKRIRHYVLLSPALKAGRLVMARAALNMPAAIPQAREDAAALLQRVAGIDITKCPHCPCRSWLTTEVLLPQRGSGMGIEQNPHPRTVAQCRSPP